MTIHICSNKSEKRDKKFITTRLALNGQTKLSNEVTKNTTQGCKNILQLAHVMRASNNPGEVR
jgi:hypothetical protein